MTTSGSYSFSVTLTDMVRHIMLNLGAIGESETPTAQEFADVQFKINMLVKQWMAKKDFAPGLKVFTRQPADLFLGYSKFQYQLGPSGDNWAAGTALVVCGRRNTSISMDSHPGKLWGTTTSGSTTRTGWWPGGIRAGVCRLTCCN